MKSMVAQNVFIVEYRHISGCLFDDKKVSLSFLDELRIIREIVDELQVETPHFDFRLILTGLKLVGKKHIEKILRHVVEGASCEDKRLAELISGFDLVNEEDFTEDIATFADTISRAQQTIQIADLPEGEPMPTFMHAGETHMRNCTNLEAAIMLKSKRIGHGFQI